MMMIMTTHCKTDRVDRLTFIAVHTGFGEPVMAWFNKENQHYEQLTDTGVLLITSEDKSVLVTAYYATIGKATFLSKMTKTPLSPALKKRIKKNEPFILAEY